jgi:hypothetical protein
MRIRSLPRVARSFLRTRLGFAPPSAYLRTRGRAVAQEPTPAVWTLIVSGRNRIKIENSDDPIGQLSEMQETAREKLKIVYIAGVRDNPAGVVAGALELLGLDARQEDGWLEVDTIDAVGALARAAWRDRDAIAGIPIDRVEDALEMAKAAEVAARTAAGPDTKKERRLIRWLAYGLIALIAASFKKKAALLNGSPDEAARRGPGSQEGDPDGGRSVTTP